MEMEKQGPIRSPDTLRPNRIPPNQRAIAEWPVLHAGGVPRLDPGAWSLRIWGLVNQERQLSFAEFAALPRVRVASDIHCVTGWSRLDNIWEGVGSETVGELSMVHPEARFVIVHGFGGFTTNLSRDDFFQPDVLLALSHDGRTLTPEHGYPVRLVVPRLYFWKSAKWVTGLRFVAEDRPGFWETRGYHNRGDPWREERYSL
jgi:DMSO/TMAO reductase YedYZ molybdopterin-dependent catalytic subunit